MRQHQWWLQTKVGENLIWMVTIGFLGAQRPRQAGISACDDRPVVYRLLLCCPPCRHPSSTWRWQSDHDQDHQHNHDHDIGEEIEISGFLLAATFQAASKYCKHESHHLIIVVANMKLSHLANKQLWFFKMERGKSCQAACVSEKVRSLKWIFSPREFQFLLLLESILSWILFSPNLGLLNERSIKWQARMVAISFDGFQRQASAGCKMMMVG